MTRPTEQECQATIVEAARLAGFRVHAQRAARTSDGWRTAIQGDPGFPDLVLAHPGRGVLTFVELKRRPNRIEPAQAAWHGALAVLGADVRVWWVPEDLDDVLAWITRRSAA